MRLPLTSGSVSKPPYNPLPSFPWIYAATIAHPYPLIYTLNTTQKTTMGTANNDIAWGKRDYACINVYEGIPESATLTPGQSVQLRFNRHATSHCSDPLAKYPAGKYNIFLYNNPVRNLDVIDYDQSIKIATQVDGTSGTINVKIPSNLPKVKNDTVWYLRLDTDLATAPQVCFFFFFFFFKTFTCLRFPVSMKLPIFRLPVLTDCLADA